MYYCLDIKPGRGVVFSKMPDYAGNAQELYREEMEGVWSFQPFIRHACIFNL